MSSLVASYRKNDEVLEIYYDSSPMDPREWDNLGTMVCLHGRYSLGDFHSYRVTDYSSWEEVREAIEKDHDIAVILPIYLYDHSGISLSTTPFNCPWDSGQVGWMFVTKQKLREEYGVKRVSKKLKEKAEKVLQGELENYSDYVNGEVYGYIIKDKSGEIVDSCWGYYGTNFQQNGIASAVGEEWAEVLN